MKNPFFSFELGMQYEDWEFDLEQINDRIDGYDSYIYIREIEILEFKPPCIELIFHWDILVAIIIQINEYDLKKAENLIEFNFIQLDYYFYISDKEINSQIHYSLLC